MCLGAETETMCNKLVRWTLNFFTHGLTTTRIKVCIKSVSVDGTLKSNFDHPKRCPSNKTFFRYFQFVKNKLERFAGGKIFQPSLIFVCKGLD
jgi:hypothetical protein